MFNIYIYIYVHLEIFVFEYDDVCVHTVDQYLHLFIWLWGDVDLSCLGKEVDNND